MNRSSQRHKMTPAMRVIEDTIAALPINRGAFLMPKNSALFTNIPLNHPAPRIHRLALRRGWDVKTRTTDEGLRVWKTRDRQAEERRKKHQVIYPPKPFPSQ